MTATHIKLDDRGRQSLRLDPEVWATIDSARLRRAGSISRNTWITEAIAEKLAREQEAEMLRPGKPEAGMFDFFEFFAGGGMVRAGLGADWRCRFANNFDAKKSAVYRRN
jgi:DNA (cytosine-5)-methyltransferase 1